MTPAQTGEDGGFEAILPADDLEALYARILAEVGKFGNVPVVSLIVYTHPTCALHSSNAQALCDCMQELVVKDSAEGPAAAGEPGQAPLNVRLAAAMGLPQLMLPFR